MVESQHTLQDLRAALLLDSALPDDVQAGDDALLLLLVLITDAIYLQRSLGRWSTNPDPINPFAPLSPYTEHKRMLSTLNTALKRWFQSFSSIETDIKAFYYYVRLYLAFSEVTSLAARLGYPGAVHDDKSEAKVPDIAAKFAWQILDTAAVASSTNGVRLPYPWLPVIVFHAGLVISTDVSNCTSAYAPSKRIVVPFVLELQQMKWPCCSTMATALETLMRDSRSV
jgi:hypothetical protein